MIRIEITRRILVKNGKGRNRINPISVVYESDLADALAEVARWQEVTEDSETMPFVQARIYDNATWKAYNETHKGGAFNPPAIKVISA